MGTSLKSNERNFLSRRCLGRYLGEKVPTVSGRPERLAQIVGGSPSVLLVSRTESPHLELLEVAAHATELAAVQQTAWIHRLGQQNHATDVAGRTP
jgi:hypothetical protein